MDALLQGANPVQRHGVAVTQEANVGDWRVIALVDHLANDLAKVGLGQEASLGD